MISPSKPMVPMFFWSQRSLGPRHVMAIVLGGDVRLLQDQADDRGVRQDAGSGAVHLDGENGNLRLGRF